MAMIGIHPVHRRLAELQLLAKRRGGWHKLDVTQQVELQHCLTVNTKVVQELDGLKVLSQMAYEVNDSTWLHEICAKIDGLEKIM